jgi:hypothetical protein
MPTRILRDGILDSERVDKLSFEAEVFYRRLMSVADDYGRFEADPVILRARCFPRRTDTITVQQIDSWLMETVKAELATVYQLSRKRFVELRDFGQRIRSKSKYPDPPADNCGQLRTIAGKCGELPPTRAQGRTESEANAKSESEANAKSESEANAKSDAKAPRFPPLDPPPNEFDYQTGFKELWDAYPPKGRTKIIDTQRVYVETVSPDPERIHGALISAVLPGGKWASSENWVRGFVCSLFEYIRNRRDLEDPEPFKPGREPTANGRLTAIERSRKSLEEVDLSDVEKAY